MTKAGTMDSMQSLLAWKEGTPCFWGVGYPMPQCCQDQWCHSQGPLPPGLEVWLWVESRLGPQPKTRAMVQPGWALGLSGLTGPDVVVTFFQGAQDLWWLLG